MVTILGMVAFLRSVLVLRMVNALVMVTTSRYFLYPPYGHKEGKGDNEDAWEIKEKEECWKVRSVFLNYL